MRTIAFFSALFGASLLVAEAHAQCAPSENLIAEQNISFLEVATRVFVLEGGHIRFSGTVAEMSGNEDLHRAYFGLK